MSTDMRTPVFAARNTIGFVGYCDPDTPGGKLLATKPGGNFVFETFNVKAKVRA